ncbi:hypothetical protein Goshw_015829 [Gossypium schwendimanii]|uniref:Uncharacterized protein n=1 Tax=Gossypium schwendimanii TaxID=34291 RepID=A0A7J9KSJ4_GOSSC|nr:hypothetical protein [Gossypium schwendimanii]
MDLERPHRSTSINNSSSSSNATSTTSELFICFTSRLSSSSMKISSKSILSPGRAREPSQISLSSSLTRRLRSNGSMKGGQASPMFPTNGKKRGCAFENPEPSSPKVTCIGQVRVKTKKQGKKFRACRSKRRGEVSFRKVDHTNNANNGSNGLEASSSFHLLSSGSQHHQQQECKKWVHFPVTICEALRAFGAEFNCFLPCRPSCMANQRDKEEKRGSNERNGNGSSCGAVFARWLVAVQEGEGKGREIELVVGGGEDDDDDDDDYDGERRKSSEMMRSSQRRHVFEDIEINDYLGDEEEEEEKGRVSICIPPKNALLLMRCRSDPVKMAALANKFLETPLPKDEQEEEEKEEVQEGAVEVEREGIERQEFSEVSEMFASCEATEEQEIPEAEAEAETEAESVLVLRDDAEVNEESSGRSSNEETILECQEQEIERKEEDDQQESTIKEETSPHVSFYLDKLYVEENEGGLDEELLQEAEDENETVSVKAEEEEYKAAVEEEAEEEESTTSTVEEKETETTQGRSESECPEPESKSKESESQEDLLPDCLLLMMCEPKLSMEVSKETWVCSTDFIRCVPEKKKKKKQQQQKPQVKQKDGGDQPKARISIDRNPAPILLHPPRSSCSFPAPPPMATAAKGGGGCGPMAKGYESFVLTRCKSEPRRSSTKLAPDACFWKNRKLEPAALEVGAAGVGF